ncbi:MAG: VCBS repeat-containing protein, partial [Cyclobacteriaceae bacterium]|nr:VCBS repeat-containing protein [Cyclobacteriaceae bacterium]
GQTFVQSKSGGFIELEQPLLKADSTFEDVDGVLFDADGDQDLDLFMVSGGNEFFGKSKYMKSRLYLNDGNGRFNQYGKLPDLFLTGSCVKISDFDKDGDLDIFLGARAIPWKYGIPPDSFILLNDGNGNFEDATQKVAPELKEFGFVNDATWADVDGDGDDDLIVAAEWRPISIFNNDQGVLKLQKSEGLEKNVGWWSAIVTADFDNDGDIDIVVGNLGLNSKLKADSRNPVKLYVNDFDKNDSTEQILTHVINGKEYPFYTRDEMTKQIPSLKKKFLAYQKFSEAEFKDFFPNEVITKSVQYSANMFESAYIENKGNGVFGMRPLPKAVQFSSANAFLTKDFNKDGNLDVMVGGNFFRSNIQMGRNDASFGFLLTGDGKGNFKAIPAHESGFSVTGEIRSIVPMKIGQQMIYLIIRNNDSVEFFTLN